MKISFPDYAFSFMEDLTASGKSKWTLKQYESDLRKFFSWLKHHKNNIDFSTFMSLRSEDIHAYFFYLHEKNLSQATIRRLASVLSRLMKFHQCISAHEIHKLAAAAPLRELNDADFVTEQEFTKLLSSMATKETNENKHSARNRLIARNMAIVKIIRSYGLTPTEVNGLTMKDINLAQNELTIISNDHGRKFVIHETIMENLREYFFSIPHAFRPKYHSSNPLFVAYNNISSSFQYDYDRQKPKELSVRAIQENIKDEVRRANLRKISAVTLRNSAILDSLYAGKTDETIMETFALTSEAALRRYKQYIEKV